jgi:hypothetical protein
MPEVRREVTLAFKCSVIGANGQVDPNSHKFLTWTYYVEEDEVIKNKIFLPYCRYSLDKKFLDVYPHLKQKDIKIVHVGKKYVTIILESNCARD